MCKFQFGPSRTILNITRIQRFSIQSDSQKKTKRPGQNTLSFLSVLDLAFALA
ncbi:hypothetical protein YQE_02883, partial [Dendroctonus ponderosae]